MVLRLSSIKIIVLASMLVSALSTISTAKNLSRVELQTLISNIGNTADSLGTPRSEFWRSLQLKNGSVDEAVLKSLGLLMDSEVSRLVQPSLGNPAGPHDDNDHWDSRFFVSGTNGYVSSICAFNNWIVVAGDFTIIDGSRANHIAAWDGSNWIDLAGGVNDRVDALLEYNGELVVSGVFTGAGGASANKIARFNATTMSWQPLNHTNGQDGLNGGVNCMTIFDGKLVVGGSFSRAGGATGPSCANIASWNGTAWTTIGNGLPDVVMALETLSPNGQEQLFAGGGYFFNSNSESGLATWNGSSWSRIGEAIDGFIYAVEKGASENDLLIGGDFFSLGSTSKFNLASIHIGDLEFGALGNPNRAVAAIEFVGNFIYVGGDFSRIESVSASRVAKFDIASNTWAVMGEPLTGDYVVSLLATTSEVLIGGAFETAKGITANIAKITEQDQDWQPFKLGLGFSSAILHAMIQYDGKLILGGLFYRLIDGFEVYSIVAFDGDSYSNLGPGFNGEVRALKLFQGDLIAAGDFSRTIDGSVLNLNGIARWNGTQWAPLGDGPGLAVFSLEEYNGQLYAGGNFEGFLKRLEGSTWSVVGGGLTEANSESGVYTLTTFLGELYAGGKFSKAGGMEALSLAAWNGSSWRNVGWASDSHPVLATAYYYGHLIIAGEFYANGPTGGFNRVAAFDGQNWTTMGLGFDTQAYLQARSLAVSNDNLYCGGDFITTGGDTVNGIAKWDEIVQRWAPLGSGVSGSDHVVNALSDFQNKLFAGGSFLFAGGRNSNNLAAWDGDAVQTPRPDLVPQQANFPSEITAGSNATVQLSFRNDGNQTAGSPWYDRLYISRYQNTGPDSLIHEFFRNTILSPGGSYHYQYDLHFVDGQEGEWWVKVRTDVTDLVDESAEGNNFLVSISPITVKPYPYPDLEVTSVSAPAAVIAGSSLRVDWEIQNSGGTPAVGGWTDRVYLSTDRILGGDIQIFNRDRSGQLGSSESYFVSQSIPIPNDLQGQYYVLVYTDILNSVYEVGPSTNNYAFSNSQVQVLPYPYPDLVVDSIEVPPTAQAGREFNLRWFVRNQGLGGTNAGSWNDRIYLSPIPTFDPFVALFVKDVANFSALDSGEAYVNGTSFILPRDRVGDYYIFVESDFNRRVEEKNEGNNRTVSDAIDIQIPPLPDMQMDSLFGPATALPGQEITINWVDHNRGDANAERTWVDAFYLSLDQSLDASDKLILSRSKGLNVIPGGLEDDFPNSMDIGGRYPGQFTFKLPQGLYGHYYLIGVIDQSDVIFEFTGESNNTTVGNQIDMTLIGPPDLVVSSVDSDSSAYSGKKMSVTWTVQNTGLGSTIDDQTIWDDRVYLSPDSTLDLSSPNTKALGTFAGGFGQFDPGEEYTLTKNVTIPNGLQGTYYVFVTTDVYNEEWENGVDTNNTTRRLEPIEVFLSPWPDLQVTSISTVDAATAGETIRISYTVSNLGNAEIDSVARQDRIYISQSENYTNAAQLLASLSVDSLMQSMQSYTRSAQVTIPAGYEGTTYIFVETDANNAVYEHSEENNNRLRSQSLLVGTYPYCDLVVSTATAPASSLSGETIAVQWQVANQSGEATLGSQWSDGVILSEDEVPGNADDLLLNTFVHSGVLGQGSSYLRTQSVRLPYGESGRRYIFVRADYHANTRESNEGNNYSLPTAIDLTSSPSPDLEISDLSVTGRLYAGQRLNIRWQVSNIGLGNTQQQSWFDAVYLSPDEIISPSDLRLGVREHIGGLLVGEDYVDSTFIDIPNYLTGQYYLLVRTDNLDKVYEGDGENNNSVSESIQLSFAPLSDLIVTDIQIPDSATPGEDITVLWTLRNIGTNPAQGFIREAVYVSEDTVWQVEDPALGVRDVEIDLAPGAFKRISSTVNLARMYHLDEQGVITEEMPGVLEGQYSVILRTDLKNSIREWNESNNETTDADLLSAFIQQLMLDQPQQFSIASRQERVFKISLDSGVAVNVDSKVDLEDGDISLSGAFARIPSLGDYDFKSEQALAPRQVLKFTAAATGSYYITITNHQTAGTQANAEIVAKVVPFSFESIYPVAGGSGGKVTCEIQGSGLSPSMRVYLTNSKGYVSEGKMTRLVAPEKMKTTFSLIGAPFGHFDLVLKWSSLDSLIVPSAFEAVPISNPTIEYFNAGPEVLRVGNVGVYDVTIKNTSNADIPYLTMSITLRSGQEVSTNSSKFKSCTELANGTQGSFDADNFVDDGQIRRVFLLARNLEVGELVNTRIYLKNVIGGPHELFPIGIDYRFQSSASMVYSLVTYFEKLRHLIVENSSSVESDLLTVAASPDLYWDKMDEVLEQTNIVDSSDFAALDSVRTWIANGLLPSGRNQYLEPSTQSLLAVDEDAPRLCTYTVKYFVRVPITVASCLPAFYACGTPPGQTAVVTFGNVPGIAACAVAGYFCYSAIQAYFNPEPFDFPEDAKDCVFETFSTEGFNVTAVYRCVFYSFSSSLCPETVTPNDPNDVCGPLGYGDKRWLRLASPMSYTIRFENDSLKATAPAQVVVITQKLDQDLDWRAFRLSSFSFADLIFEVPENAALYSKRLDVREKLGVYVDVTAGIKLGTGEAFWNFRSIDPLTGTTPTDPLAGLLPVNNAAGDGNGFVSYTIKPKATVQSGDVINAQASIVFDINEPIATPEIFNTIDATAPTSEINALPSVSTSKQISLQWLAEDPIPGSGIRDFALYMSVNDSAYQLVVSGIETQSFMFEGDMGKKYAFYTIAYDNVGNSEPAPISADATVTISSGVCGDFNSSGEINLTDVVMMVNYIFLGGPQPTDPSRGDIDCNGRTNIGDAVKLVYYLYSGGPMPCAGC